MKKWLVRMAMAAAVVVLGSAAIFLIADGVDRQNVVKRINNENLPIVKPGWEGNGLDESDRFVNEYHPYVPGMLKVLKWKLGGNPLKDAKESDTWRPDVRDPRDFLSSGREGIQWLGHASFYIRIGGVAILIDPVFGDPAFLRRIVPVASQLEYIDRVEYVLVSHDHRDHMDENSLRQIAARFPNATFLAGLRSEDTINAWKSPTNRLLTAGWFQEFDTGDARARFLFLPARHWSRRGLLDTNRRLWGSYVIQAGSKTIFFTGDSAYDEHFREAGELFPKIDYFIVGVGTYEPRWFMEPVHQDPAEAVAAFVDSKAQLLIPMHYGTFELSDEPYGDPLRRLTEAARAAGVEDMLRPLAINEALFIDN
jgi:L-ascorbate metabolism protein UlaG (beta-lactamase superfamily)